MKITAIETIRLRAYPTVLWVEVHTDAGVTGLGETFRDAGAVAAFLHEIVAPEVLGADPFQIEDLNRRVLHGVLGFASSSVETRAASALDIALWDIFGQAHGQPVWQMLGGRCRERIPVYNTCAGYDYNTGAERWRTVEPGTAPSDPKGPYDDQLAFVHSPVELAESLLAEGFRAMKIWPFDVSARDSAGHSISSADLARGLEPFERIRAAVGDRIEIMAEFHSLWSLPAAIRIGQELAPLRPYWAEDPIRLESAASLADYRARTGLPVCASEVLATRMGFRPFLEEDAVDYVMLDLSWCGGLTEARKIASLAEAYQRPVAPHDCTGPVVLTASVHFALHAPNCLMQEVVRAYLAGWYRDVVTALPDVMEGYARPPDGVGLGLALQPAIRQRPDATVQRSSIV
jgi:galactonate dehydratase